MDGRIVKVVADRGFCFVKPDEGDRDYFAHIRAFVDLVVLDQDLVGRAVSFDIRPRNYNKGGEEAYNLRLS